MENALEQLKKYTTVVADTGNFEGKLLLKFLFPNLKVLAF